ncbi:hypothetical protein BH23VER1_BH23VER1_12680 [soil metagenome]
MRPPTLLLLLLLISAPVIPGRLSGEEVDSAATIRFLLAHEKPNGAFGPLGQDHTDLAWNYPAVHALALLGQGVPRPEDAFRNGRDAAYLEDASHHKTWSRDIYQRAHLAAVLEREPGPEYDLRESWNLEYFDRDGWYYPRIDAQKLRERVATFYDIPSLWHFVGAVTVSGGTVENPQDVSDFVAPRQCPSGGFEDAYRADAPRDDSAAHVVATASAVLALRALGLDVANQEACVEWIRSCQAEDGGFRWNPSNSSHSNKPDVWYTWCAVRSLMALDAKPRDPDACLSWINSLQNADGGFGDRPGWASRLYSTYHAVHALDLLTGDAAGAIASKEVTRDADPIPEGTYSIFQAHLKSPTGGPDMVEAAKEMGFNFLGVKSNTPDGPPDTLDEARAYTAEKGYPLELVGNPENYGHKLEWLGGHPAHHVSNWLVPPAMTAEQRERFEAADEAGRKGLPWDRYREEVIAPLLEMGSLVYPEMDYTMANAYQVYDDGLDGETGYNAVIGALGWAPWDWIRMFPYRERWVGRHPMVADGDAHGDIEKWGERLDRQRTLYIAKGHGLDEFLDACRDNRTVCVIRRGDDRSELVLYGTPAAVAYARKNLEQWKWWP